MATNVIDGDTLAPFTYEYEKGLRRLGGPFEKLRDARKVAKEAEEEGAEYIVIHRKRSRFTGSLRYAVFGKITSKAEEALNRRVNAGYWKRRLS